MGMKAGGVAAGEAAERHPAAERHHVDAHDAAAQVVGDDELHERRGHREDHEQRRAAAGRAARSSPSRSARQRERRDERAEDELHDEQRQAHVLEAPEPRDDERADDGAQRPRTPSCGCSG